MLPSPGFLDYGLREANVFLYIKFKKNKKSAEIIISLLKSTKMTAEESVKRHITKKYREPGRRYSNKILEAGKHMVE